VTEESSNGGLGNAALFASDALAILGKDLRIELRTRELIVTMGFFAVLVAVICSLSFYVEDDTARKIAPGVIWVAVAFAGSLGLVRAFAREREEGAWTGLLLTPASRAAIFLGKAAFSFVFMTLTEVLVVPCVGIFFHIDMLGLVGPLALVLALSTLGYAVTGTVFAAMTVRTRARDLMLSVVLFPLVAPGILSGVVATRELFDGSGLAGVVDWLKLLGVMDVLFLVGALWIFDPLMKD
jgi:heme exporter protein B